MKHLLFIICFICWQNNVFTQPAIEPIYNNENYGYTPNVYYKDTYNDLNVYVGTWIYTNGTTSLTITLQKKVMMQVEDISGNYSYFEDTLIGEYKYIKNGTEMINTLPQLLLNFPKSIEYNISGNAIIGPQSLYCNDCSPTDRKLLLSFNDPTCYINGYDPEMIFQRVDSDGVQKLRLRFRTTSGIIVEEGVTPPCTEYKIPFGTYILIKQ